MSNLLPEKSKEEIHSKFFYRKLTVLTMMIAFLVFIACVLLLAIHIYLSFGGVIEREKGKSLSELSPTDQLLVKEAQSLNQKLEVLLPSEDSILPSEVILSAIDDNIEGVRLHHLALECQIQTKTCIVAVLGRAENRQSLLDYVAKLKQNKLFKTVESPINNLISDKDSQFSLELETNLVKDLID